jgi:hypothetical protein
MKTSLMLAVVFALIGVCVGAAQTNSTQVVKVSLKAPDATWNVRIADVYDMGTDLWCVATLFQKPGMGAMVITTVSDQATVVVPGGPKPVKVLVLGKTWKWANDEPYRFLASPDEIAGDLKKGALLKRK